MEKTFSIITFGCKLNQSETEWIRESLIRRNWAQRGFQDGAAVCVINSCTVTARSDARCRSAARRAKRINPRTFVLVTGCFAETQRTSLERMDEVDLVLGNREKGSIPAIVDAAAERERKSDPADVRGASGRDTTDRTGIDRFFGHTRAFVKIQEGCNSSCSYCIVPRARGRSRSVPAAAVLEQVKILRVNGYHEVVLTGVHIGQYGADLDPRTTLADLVEAIIERTDAVRVRLSSIEINEVTPRLLDFLRSTDRFAPHLHIPLQSGDDRILEAMGRSYRSGSFRDKIEEIAGIRAGVAIGTDLIVGFPGETEACFENTYQLVRDLPITYLHVFGFSPRPGTPAASMGSVVGGERRRWRSARLVDLGETKKRAFLESHVGSTQIALVQRSAHERSSFVPSLTGTYCEVLVPKGTGAPGSLVPIHVRHFSRGSLYGAPPEGNRERQPVAGACAR